MEHDDLEVNRWVEERLASLEPSRDWKPDSRAALAGLRRRDTPRDHRWWLWATLSATAAACVAILVLSAPQACANPLGCKQVSQPAPAPAAPVMAPAVAPSPAPPKAAVRKHDFKESGSPTAPLTCEFYTDYECPHCATFYLETLPPLVSEYVQTGKVRLIHRDYPLPQHPHAQQAARFANAAGELGYYQLAATRLFRTQQVWSGDGDIAQQLASALPPAIMKKVSDLVDHGPAVDTSTAADEAMGREDHLNQTPTVVLVTKGNRLVIGGYLSFSDLKDRIDRLLASQ
jgi:protein-disulfide isomerase